MKDEVSFIIPAFNEELNIPHLIKAIKANCTDKLIFEIIIIDHDSTDHTVQLAKSLGARVSVKSGGTVASLRNYGVTLSLFENLIFLDADVLVTEKWAENIHATLNYIQNNYKTVTGSRCGIPRDAGFIEHYWFGPLLKNHTRSHYINSGHLITTKRLFNEIGGFDESLVTGEDYDFSVRAATCGAAIIENPDLFVVHEGYPKNLLQFYKREIWHGTGDFKSISTFINSKVAMIAEIFFILHILVITAFILNQKIIGVIFFCLIAALCLLSSYKKFKNESIMYIIINSGLYYIYLLARACSLFSVLLNRTSIKRHR